MADDYGSSPGAGNLGALTIGGSKNGALEAGADHDWFQMTLVAGQSYIFNMDRGTMADPRLVLRDQNGVDIVGNDDISGANLNSQIRFTATVSGTYFLDAFSPDGADTGTYTVRAAIDPSPPASNDDYGAQAGSPNVGTVAIGGSTNGNLETADDRDWFAVTLTAGTSYTFRQNSITLNDTFLRLRDGNGLLIAANDDIGGGNFNSLINYTAATTGVYYLEANTADQGGTGTYTVSAAVNGNPPPPPADDYGSQVGAGNLGSVAVGSSSTGLVNYGGDHDWFAVTLSVGSSYRIRQEVGTLADPRFTLRNSIGGVLTGDDDSGGGQNAQVDFTATSSGTYYIDANSADGAGTGTYTVRVTLLYGAPVIVNNTGSTAAEGAADTITASELSTTDPDSAASAIIYTLTSAATNGTLTRNGTTIALNGTFTQADINSNLIVYNHNGSETTTGSFGFSVSDGTTSFTGRTFNFNVTAVNDAPVNTVPAAQTINEDAQLIFSSANSNAITVSDVDAGAGTLTVTLDIADGALILGGTNGLSVTGQGGHHVVLTGTVANINAGLNNLSYQPASDFNGVRTLSVTTSDNGNTGSGGTKQDIDTITINITAVDDPPTAVNDPGNVVAENATRNINVIANDSDPDGPSPAVAQINGNAIAVGGTAVLGSGATVKLEANGTVTYDPNHAFDATPVAGSGASNTPAADSFTYTLTGGGTATVTMSITGVDSDDRLIGTGGNDTLIGGIGNDTYVVGNSGDSIVEQAGAGTDTVETALAVYILNAANVENLTGTSNAGQVLAGNGLDNRITGGTGNDTMNGGLGNDTYVVLNSGDTIIEQGGGGTDTVETNLASYILNAANVENLTGTSNAGQSLGGNSLDNVITGGTGNDEMQGGLGNDTYVVLNTGDTIVEQVGGGTDTVQTGLASYILQAANVENLTGTSNAGQALEGNSLDNRITGGTGNDVLHGGLGDDTYVVRNAGDTIVELAGQGTDTIETALNYYVMDAPNVENLTFTGVGDFYGSGNSGDNLITGGGGNDILRGGLGNDTLVGGAGNDFYLFDTAPGAGNIDTINGFVSGSDHILLDNAIFTAIAEGGLTPGSFVIGTQAGDADDRIIYDNTTGALYYDADGSGAGLAVQFATLQGHPALTANDFSVI